MNSHTHRSYMGGDDCPSPERIDGRVVIITGSSSGIGRATALELAKRGGKIILAVRDESGGNQVARQIKDTTGAIAQVKIVDLSSLASVRRFASEIGKISLY